MHLIRFACFTLVLVSATLAVAATPGPSTMQIALKPEPGADGRTIESIEISIILAGPVADPATALLELAHVTFNVPSAAERIELIEAHDEMGSLHLSARDQGEGDAARRQWFADRPLNGEMTLRYRVAVDAALAPRGAAPPTELRKEGGAVSGSGAAFILRPPAGSFRFRVTWDLSALGPGATAVSSLGYQPQEVLPVEILDSVYFMAGMLGRYPADAAESGFFSAWQGDPPFDAAQLMATAETLRVIERSRQLRQDMSPPMPAIPARVVA